jgi:hypothetical protein
MYLNPLLVNNPENAPVPPEFVRDIFLNIQRIFKLTCEFLKKYTPRSLSLSQCSPLSSKLTKMSRFKTSIARANAPSPPSSPAGVPPPNKSHTYATIIPTSNLGDVSFGELFLWLFNETKIISEYIEYINGFDTSRLLIEGECAKNPKFRDYLEKCRVCAFFFFFFFFSPPSLSSLSAMHRSHPRQVTPDCKGLTIQSLLIMPVQRIPRHILLLTDLAKHTPPEHPDFDLLTKAVERTKEVAIVINDAKGRAESNTKVTTPPFSLLSLSFTPLPLLVWLQLQMTLLQSSLLGSPDNFVLHTPERLLIKDGSMMLSEDRKKGGSKYAYLYLFNGIQNLDLE